MLDALAARRLDRRARRATISAPPICFLRAIEHRLQMVADEQTHTLARRSRAGMEQFARFVGFADRDDLRRSLARPSAQRAAALRGPVRARTPPRAPSAAAWCFLRMATIAKRSTSCSAMGFRQPLEISALVRRWQTAGYRSLEGPFAREQLADIVPMLLRAFRRFGQAGCRAASPSTAFLPGCMAAAGCFRCCGSNPDLIALIALVLGTAPRLADSLAQFPQVMDAVIDPSFFGALPEQARACARRLDRSLAQAGSPTRSFSTASESLRRSRCS